jgi:hypothetical protein
VLTEGRGVWPKQPRRRLVDDQRAFAAVPAKIGERFFAKRVAILKGAR